MPRKQTPVGFFPLELPLAIPAELGPAAELLAELRDRVRAVELEREAERARTGRRVLGESVADIADSKGDFLNTPTIFGNKAQDVANGAEAAVGQSNFLITFSISGPGVRLPDLQEVLFNNSPDYMPINFSFTSTTPGKRADGTKAVLQVNQAGSFTDAQTGWVYTAEKVEIVGAPSN